MLFTLNMSVMNTKKNGHNKRCQDNYGKWVAQRYGTRPAPFRKMAIYFIQWHNKLGLCQNQSTTADHCLPVSQDSCSSAT